MSGAITSGGNNWTPGMASPNPSGRPARASIAKKGLAMACREAASDEEIADWLLTIAIEGKWPSGRKGKKAIQQAAIAEGLAELVASPPDGTHRMAALKEFLLRRDGAPMQAVMVKAEVEARARMIDNASEVIDVGAIDALAAGALEVALSKALEAGRELAEEADPVIP